MAPFVRYEKGELAQDLWLEVASALRGELLDFFITPMIDQTLGVGDASRDLKQRREEVLADDQGGQVAMLVETIAGEEETVYPIQALDLVWDAGERAMMLLSVGKSESITQWFVSIVVAPYLEYLDEARGKGEALAILERRWDEIPGDGSLTGSLVLGLSGDLEGLAKLGFVDRSCRVNDQ